jgi:hypothetical protein
LHYLSRSWACAFSLAFGGENHLAPHECFKQPLKVCFLLLIEIGFLNWQFILQEKVHAHSRSILMHRQFRT